MAFISAIPNDTRGWIMCLISAIACVAGACIICVDVFIRLLPGKKNFNIQDSNAFLACSLSLSFGVMMFSSLYSMLPSSKRYLLDDGVVEPVAGLLMMGGFSLGFVGMQIVSRIIHRLMPSHVVDCDHSHDGDSSDKDGGGSSVEQQQQQRRRQHEGQQSQPSYAGSHHGFFHSHAHPRDLPRISPRESFARQRPASQAGVGATESTPLLSSAVPLAPRRQLSTNSDDLTAAAGRGDARAPPLPLLPRHDGADVPNTVRGKRSLTLLRRPSMVEVRNRVLCFVKDTKANCDESGPCYGYTDPCGQECKRTVVLHTPALVRGGSSTSRPPTAPAAETLVATTTTTTGNPTSDVPLTEGEGVDLAGVNSNSVSHDPADHVEMQEGDPEAFIPASSASGEASSSTNVSNDGAKNTFATAPHDGGDGVRDGLHQQHGSGHDQAHDHADVWSTSSNADDDLEAGGVPQQHQQQHHHHVPTNAFLSIGLQTVLAIGLHKFPEGFITFATNHANPALGFNVFAALFVHNIAEGFAMALPLYMAFGSRLRAILSAVALGGLSQPLGAGAAVLWLRHLGQSNGGGGGGGGGADDPNDAGNGTAYGVLFAVTAGIMTAVALQLFVESLTLHHNRQLTTAFAFAGMLVLGLSNSLGTH
ncbi:zip metal ion transporter [Niveomyces insectorum RCEF 264]|uniref:Zip metal ion transporter n=1 Tax=Niveomyces insectorum RCEF 264 TaxID=1081102 RepID=A0A167RHP2_9HYPO|nr:zip metal ion transporter [Niveomyces insectorum RCEF 264]